MEEEEHQKEEERNGRSAVAKKIPSRCTAAAATKTTAMTAIEHGTAKALERSTSGYPSKNTWQVRKTMVAVRRVLRVLLKL